MLSPNSIGGCLCSWYVTARNSGAILLTTWEAQSDPRFARTESYGTAQLLQGTHGFCSGSKRLFECRESWRSSLVHNTKCMGLFRERTPATKECSNLQERWQAWIAQEKLRRLAWAVYVRVLSCRPL